MRTAWLLLLCGLVALATAGGGKNNKNKCRNPFTGKAMAKGESFYFKGSLKKPWRGCQKIAVCRRDGKKLRLKTKRVNYVKDGKGGCKPPMGTSKGTTTTKAATTTTESTTTAAPNTTTTTAAPAPCGVDGDGKPREPGAVWYNSDCTQRFECKCNSEGVCKVEKTTVDGCPTTTTESTTTTTSTTTTADPAPCGVDGDGKPRQPDDVWYNSACTQRFECKCNSQGLCKVEKTTVDGCPTTTTESTTTTTESTTSTTTAPSTTTTKKPLVCIDMYGKERQPGEKWFSYDCKKKFKCKCNKKKCWVKEKDIDWIKDNGKCIPPKTTTTAKGTTTTTTRKTTTTSEDATTTTPQVTKPPPGHPCGKDEDGNYREDGDVWWNKRCSRKFRCKCNKWGKKCRVVKKKKNYAPWKGGCRKPCPPHTARRGRKCVPILCDC